MITGWTGYLLLLLQGLPPLPSRDAAVAVLVDISPLVLVQPLRACPSELSKAVGASDAAVV